MTPVQAAAALALLCSSPARAQVPYHRMNEVADPAQSELYQERAKKIPGVYSNRREEADPDVRKSPYRRDLGTLVLHFADVITDLNTREEQVDGVDMFIKRLELELQPGNDKPRDDILRNAEEARLHLKYAHDDFLRMIRPFLQVRQIFQESYGVLRAVRETSDPYLPSLEEASEAMRRTVEQMKPDEQPPDSTGQDVDLNKLYQIQDMAQYLEPLRDRLEEAAQLVSYAKGSIESAEFRRMEVERLTQKAVDLDANFHKKAAESRTRPGGASNQGPSRSQSHEVLSNALHWLAKTVENAKEVHELLERHTKPDQPGLRQTLEETLQANEEIQKSKESSLQAGERVNQAHRRIRDEIKPEWLQSPPPRQQELQEQARAAKEASREGSTGARKAVDKAKEKDGKARESFKKLKEDMEKLKERLGDRRQEDFTEIGMLYVNVPPVRKPHELPRRGHGQNHKSQPLRMPQDLSRSADEIHGMMEGRPLAPR